MNNKILIFSVNIKYMNCIFEKNYCWTPLRHVSYRIVQSYMFHTVSYSHTHQTWSKQCAYREYFRGASTQRSILLIVSTIVLRFYTQVCFCICLCLCFCIFLFFFLLGFNYGHKTWKGGHFWSQITLSFQLIVNFLSPVCLGHYFENNGRGDFWFFFLYIISLKNVLR